MATVATVATLAARANVTTTTLPPAEDESNETLLVRFRARRDPRDFETLVRRNQQFAFRVARCISSNGAWVEEAVQEVFLRLADSRFSFQDRGPGSFRSWFYAMVANVTRMHTRNERRRMMRDRNPMYLDDAKARYEQGASAQAAASMEGAETPALVRDALDALAEDLRLPLVLHFLEGMQQSEVGKVLGIGQSQVSRRLAQGLDLLRKRLNAAGVSFSVAALPGLLQGVPEFQAPAELGFRIMGRMTRAARASCRIARSAASKAASFKVALALIVVAMAVGMAALHGTTSTGVVQPKSQAGSIAPPTSPIAEPEEPPEPKEPAMAILRHWTFNSSDGQEDLEVTRGAWCWVANGGPDGSGCMETTEDTTVVALRLSRFKLPIVASLHGYYFPEASGKERLLSTVAHEKYSQAAVFHNVGTPILQDPKRSRWLPNMLYVTEGYVDSWVSDRRFSFHTYQKPRGRLVLLLKGRQRIDDLSIRECNPKELPDVTAYLSALERIPLAKRIGTVQVPELRSPAPNKEVFIVFGSPTTANP